LNEIGKRRSKVVILAKAEGPETPRLGFEIQFNLVRWSFA